MTDWDKYKKTHGIKSIKDWSEIGKLKTDGYLKPRPPMSADDYLNSLRGRTLTDKEVQMLLAYAITVNRYAIQKWYKKIKRF